MIVLKHFILRCFFLGILVFNFDFSHGLEQTVFIDYDAFNSWQQLKDAFTNIGDFYSTRVRRVQDLWSYRWETLNKDVEETIVFLETVKENEIHILKRARVKNNKKLEQALVNIDTWLQDARQFQETLHSVAPDSSVENYLSATNDTAGPLTSEASLRFHKLGRLWQLKTKKMWQNGLDTLALFARRLRTSNPTKKIYFNLPQFFPYVAMLTATCLLITFCFIVLDYLRAEKIHQESYVHYYKPYLMDFRPTPRRGIHDPPVLYDSM